jgi:hypothetical protein
MYLEMAFLENMTPTREGTLARVYQTSGKSARGEKKRVVHEKRFYSKNCAPKSGQQAI